MGCDIHLYVEYKYVHSDGTSIWLNFCDRMNPGRNYELFSRLANVRGYDSDLAKPRGLPKDIGWLAKMENRIFISNANGDGVVSKETARRWIKEGISKKVDKNFVTHPAWHSHSWLSLQEFKERLGQDVDVQYKAICAAMDEFERSGHLTRVVFWFDN